MLHGDSTVKFEYVHEAIQGGPTICVPSLELHLCDAGPEPAVAVASTQSFERWRRLSENLQGSYIPVLPAACTLCGKDCMLRLKWLLNMYMSRYFMSKMGQCDASVQLM